MLFVGREYELDLLREPNWRDHAKLAVLYGRRRVGKTALVEEAFAGDLVWKFEGVENAKASLQIALFLEQLSHYTGEQVGGASSWSDCFRLLDAALVEQFEVEPSRRLVVFFDEFQWMCSMRSTLVSEFKFFWDNYFRKHQAALFILCGSISSFIVRRVVQSKALYGRVDLELHLKPLSSRESASFFPEDRPEEERLQAHLLFGGIPQYLIELNPKRSLIQNINESAFRPSGYFFQEFDRLFLSHFATNPRYKKILERLASGPAGSAALAKAVGASTGGSLTRLLEELELAGFIERYSPLAKPRNSRLVRYRLLDEYLHLYFALILPNARRILAGSVNYAQITQTPAFGQWLGLAFERFCLRNAVLLADHLRFSGIAYEFGAWFRRGDSSTSAPGAQVDLAFLRADKMITACEMKYAARPRPKEWALKMEARKAALQDAFPGYGLETVLVLGKGSIESTPWFDHVVRAESFF